MIRCKECCWWSPNRKDIEANKPKLCLNPTLNIVTDDNFGCIEAVSKDSVEVNVPNHTPRGISMSDNSQVDGPVEVLIVTYSKDFPWLVCALRSIRKFLTGFQGVTIAHPQKDAEQFNTLLHQFDVRLHSYNEVPGKGMIQHMAMMALADTYLPATTKYVLHTDADCIFKMPTRPSDYFHNGKPYYLIRPWDSLTSEDPRRPGSKVISDCAQWRQPTTAQLGFDSEWYTMCMNTAVLPIGFYKPYREHIEGVHNQKFLKYMLLGRNEFPQSRMDWTAMGAWAHRFMNDSFSWFNIMKDEYPQDRKTAFWSHGGVTPDMQAQVEHILSLYVPTQDEVERMSQ